MNHRGGFALIKATWFSWMQYRSFFFVLAFGWMIPPLVARFVWSAAAGEGSLGGFTRGEFITYYLVLVLVNQITYAQVNWTVGDIIREGTLNHWLLKPLSAIYQALSSELAGKVVYLIFVIPVGLLLAILLKPEIDTTPVNIILSLLATLLAWGLRFAWGFWLAILAFWITRADSFLALQDSLVFIFSGMVAPIPLLQGSLQQIAKILPFRYMVGFPVEILVYDLSDKAILFGFLMQLAWLTIAVMLSRVLWVKGIRHYSAVGG
jgi:ABC-2 type transport system permease protein